MDYYEDIEVGDTMEFGSYEVTQDEIIEFAEEFDPQPFHVDPEAAEETWFGGLIASGWHTAAMTMRMLVDNYISESGAMGAVGVDDLRWPAPVRPGDRLHVEGEILDKQPWQPGMGLVRSFSSTRTDDDDREVMTMVGLILFDRREDGE